MATAIALGGYSAAQLRTIKNTVAADTNELEFDLFMEAARSYGLDPFRRQINAVVYNKDRPDKRKMSIIVSRDGLRVIAQRCGDYRPASEPAQVVYDDSAKGATNPKGIVSATVRLWKHDKRGDWYPVVGEAYWDEFAPLREVWAYDQQENKRKPTGVFELDQTSTWARMPVVMITKCAESQALRAGWPDQFGGIYAEEEMHQLEAQVSASQALHEHDRQERQARIGGLGLMMVFDDSARLEKVAIGQAFDRCAQFVNGATPEEAYKFRVRNEAALREFWAHDKAAALELKKMLEAKASRFNPSEAA